MKSLLRRVVDFRTDDERKAMLWTTAYGFLIFLSYYILRVVREEISSADGGDVQILWTAVFLAMLVAGPPLLVGGLLLQPGRLRPPGESLLHRLPGRRQSVGDVGAGSDGLHMLLSGG